MADYTKIPSKAKVKPTPFEANIPEDKLQQLLQLVKLSPIGIETYENTTDTSGKWGISRKWLADAKEHWTTKYDWRASEKRINSYPNYTAEVKDDDGRSHTVHFIALFSDKEDAIPIAFYHGWPGSFLEFLDLLDLIKKKYSPADLPYHIIVPSLPGYAFSSGPPPDKDADLADMAKISFRLLHELGFKDSGYIAQGGDLGSFVSRHAALVDDACKAYHLNMYMVSPPANAAELELTELEKKWRPSGKAWLDFGTAYGQEHGTRTATIGLALSSSPLALLAWIGEKFVEWSDESPPLERILESVSLYWLTDTFPRCIYPYRSLYGPHNPEIQKKARIMEASQKPLGFSWFPKELVPTPLSWIGAKANLVHSSQHDKGGHFAALEQPELLFADVEEFIKKVWK